MTSPQSLRIVPFGSFASLTSGTHSFAQTPCLTYMALHVHGFANAPYPLTDVTRDIHGFVHLARFTTGTCLSAGSVARLWMVSSEALEAQQGIAAFSSLWKTRSNVTLRLMRLIDEHYTATPVHLHHEFVSPVAVMD